MKDFYNQEWTRSERILMTTVTFFVGIVVGFLLAPIKKGIYCGNNNGNGCLQAEDKEQSEE